MIDSFIYDLTPFQALDPNFTCLVDGIESYDESDDSIFELIPSETTGSPLSYDNLIECFDESDKQVFDDILHEGISINHEPFCKLNSVPHKPVRCENLKRKLTFEYTNPKQFCENDNKKRDCNREAAIRCENLKRNIHFEYSNPKQFCENDNKKQECNREAVFSRENLKRNISFEYSNSKRFCDNVVKNHKYKQLFDNDDKKRECNREAAFRYRQKQKGKVSELENEFKNAYHIMSSSKSKVLKLRQQYNTLKDIIFDINN